MEVYLRQIEHNNPHPLNIDLTEDIIVIGKDGLPELDKYAQVSKVHAYFIKKKCDWFVKDLKSSHGTYVNRLRIENQLCKLEIGDHIGFGVEDVGTGFVCALSVRKKSIFAFEKEIIDISDDCLPIVKQEPETACPNSWICSDLRGGNSLNGADVPMDLPSATVNKEFLHSTHPTSVISTRSEGQNSPINVKEETLQDDNLPLTPKVGNSPIAANVKQEKICNSEDTCNRPSALHTYSNGQGCSLTTDQNDKITGTPNDTDNANIERNQSNGSSLSKNSYQHWNLKTCHVPLTKCDYLLTSNIIKLTSECLRSDVKTCMKEKKIKERKNLRSSVRGKKISNKYSIKLKECSVLLNKLDITMLPSQQEKLKDCTFAVIHQSAKEKCLSQKSQSTFSSTIRSETVQNPNINAKDQHSDSIVKDIMKSKPSHFAEQNPEALIPTSQVTSLGLRSSAVVKISSPLSKDYSVNSICSNLVNPKISKPAENTNIKNAIGLLKIDSDCSVNSVDNVMESSACKANPKSKRPRGSDESITNCITAKQRRCTLLIEPPRKKRQKRLRRKISKPSNPVTTGMEKSPIDTALLKILNSDKEKHVDCTSAKDFKNAKMPEDINAGNTLSVASKIRKIVNMSIHEIESENKNETCSESVDLIVKSVVVCNKVKSKDLLVSLAPKNLINNDLIAGNADLLSEVVSKSILPQKPINEQQVDNERSVSCNLAAQQKNDRLVSDSILRIKKSANMLSTITADTNVPKLVPESNSATSSSQTVPTPFPASCSFSTELDRGDENCKDVYDVNAPPIQTGCHAAQRQVARISESTQFPTKSPVLAPPSNTEDFYKTFPQLCPSPKKEQRENNSGRLRDNPISLSFSDAAKVNGINMIKTIVELNVKWLKEYPQVRNPPPIIYKGVAHLPLFFESFEHYVSAFLPLLRLDIWENIYQESKLIWQDPRRRTNRFFFSITSLKDRGDCDMTEYHCEAVLNPTYFPPIKGNLIVMEVNDESSPNGTTQEILGYITKDTTLEVSHSQLNEVWLNIRSYGMNKASLCKFSALTKHRQISPPLNCLMRGNGICSIRNKLLLADGIANLKSSPLFKNILFPDESTFFVKKSSRSDLEEDLTEKRIVKKLSAGITENTSENKIYLLHALPGTQKKLVIEKLVETLIQIKNFKQKILIVAPTDAAVDAIGIAVKASSLVQTHLINMVRMGNVCSIDSKMKPFSLDTIASSKRDSWYRKEVRSLEKLIAKKKKALEVVKTSKNVFTKREKKLLQQCMALEEKLKSLHLIEADWVQKLEVLKDSDIVLTTLDCCDDLIFQASTSICCIIDNATQCTELEVLRTLMYRTTNLVLIGDPQQLPPSFSSKLAANYGYSRSMFERFNSFFSKYHQKSPMLKLTRQCDMHSEICLFPSKYFYSDQLSTPLSIDSHYNSFLLYPYVVFDIAELESPVCKSSLESYYEAIISMCTCLLDLNLRASIGIITTSEMAGQYYLYPNIASNKVEIGTIEQMEERRKDIVILLCWNPELKHNETSFLSCEKRLNAALTKARQCLVLCLCSSLLDKQSVWGALLQDAKRRHLYRSVDSASDMAAIFYDTMVKKG